MKIREVASGLAFPEGPVALDDGSILLVEIARGTLTRVAPDGRVSVVAELGGGPNGAAIGPDGACYVCNNGGFRWHRDPVHGLRPVGQPDDYSGGRIERVDLATGRFERLYDAVDGHPLRGPNDLVFDAAGGMWFSDLGKVRPRDRDQGGVYYARADGSRIREAAYPVLMANGVGLSPDGATLYVAETESARLWAFDVTAPGELAKRPFPSPHGGRLVHGAGGYRRFDSLAVDALGNVCVATLIEGGITVVSPDGRYVTHVPMPDLYTTNLCFGGPDLRTAYVTLSGTGKLVAVDWPVPGLALNFAR
ncbi:MAG: SMP-30/gluconolactonase/LRE family protein [Burkholderiales bacterium]|nr:SMP-30/gluconolactonase/LRE family protein [Burkholderiales bacterium]